MPHVSEFGQKMRKGRGDSKKRKLVTRERSDLKPGEFGANTRNKDDSLSGKALSPHWNEKEEV